MSILNAFLAGGGGGFEYESGSFTPTAQTQSQTVNFEKIHTKPPAIMLCIDAANTQVTAQYSGLAEWVLLDAEQILGTTFYWGTYPYKGHIFYAYNNGSQAVTANQILTYGSTDTSESGSNASRRYAREGAATFQIYNGYFLVNRKYVWVAIWLPDSWVQPT